MRIVYDGRGLSGNRTGSGNVLGWLLDRLRADAPQHEYVVLTPAAAGWRLRRHLWWEQVEFPRQAARLRADVLHVPGGTSTPILRRRRTVLTLHDLALKAHPEWLPAGPGRWYWGRWVPWTAAFADCVLVGSRAARADALRLAGIEARRVRVTPWGVPPDMAAGAARRRDGATAPWTARAVRALRRHHRSTKGPRNASWRARPPRYEGVAGDGGNDHRRADRSRGGGGSARAPSARSRPRLRSARR